MYGRVPYTGYMQVIQKNQQSKQERLEARVHPELKMRLQYAADLQGSSLSEFLLRSAEKAANEIIRDEKVLTLSAEDSRAFVNAIFNPPQPNKKLKEAYLRYKREVDSVM